MEAFSGMLRQAHIIAGITRAFAVLLMLLAQLQARSPWRELAQ